MQKGEDGLVNIFHVIVLES